MPMTTSARRCDMEYHFHGWRDAPAVHALDAGAAGIHTLLDLYDALYEVWCADTCAPRMRKDWNKDNRTLGQCSITAFLVQDLFGGKVYGIPLGDGHYHCYNVIGDHVFDLTSEQFEGRILVYENNPEQYREDHFAGKEKYSRYLKLRELLKEYISLNIIH